MKKILQFVCILFPLFCFSQNNLEDQLYGEYIEACQLIDKYKLTQSQSKLDSIYDIARSNNLEYIIGRVNNGYGLIFAHIGEYKNASDSYKIALEIDTRIKADSSQIIRDYGNLLYCFTQTQEHQKFDSIIPIAFSYVTKKNVISNHVLLTSNAFNLYKRKEYKKVIDVANEGLKLIKNERDLNKINNDSINDDRLNYYDIYHRMNKVKALINYDQNYHEAYAVFSKLNKDFPNLEKNISIEFQSLIDISDYYFHCHLYYKDYKKNIDSAIFYLDKSKLFDTKSIASLKDLNSSRNEYVYDFMKKTEDLKRVNLTNKYNQKINSRSIFIAVLLGLIVLILLFFMIKNKKDQHFKEQMYVETSQLNKKLQQNIGKRRDLEHKLNDIQVSIASDLHDNFGNRLSGLLSSSDVLKEFKVSKDFGSVNFWKFLDHLDYTLLSLLFDIKDLIWANNSNNNQIIQVSKRLNEVAKEFSHFYKKKVTFTSKIKENMVLPNLSNRQILLFYKEAINNACVHAKTKEVITELRFDETGYLELIIQDKGSGFEIDEIDRISGINNLKLRAKSIGCELEINSKTNLGTVIILKGKIAILPLAQKS